MNSYPLGTDECFRTPNSYLRMCNLGVFQGHSAG